MKIPGWIQKILDLVSATDFEDMRKRAHVKKCLEKLRRKRDKLKKRLEDEPDEAKRKLIEKSLALVRAQRKRGLKVLRALKKAKGKKKEP